MTVYLVISLSTKSINTIDIWFWPTLTFGFCWHDGTSTYLRCLSAATVIDGASLVPALSDCVSSTRVDVW